MFSERTRGPIWIKVAHWVFQESQDGVIPTRSTLVRGEFLRHVISILEWQDSRMLGRELDFDGA